MFTPSLRRALVALVLALPTVSVAGFADVLDTPADTSALASKALLNGLATAGKRMIAVGQRGHVVYSDDSGASWQQARVPVSSFGAASKWAARSAHVGVSTRTGVRSLTIAR